MTPYTALVECLLVRLQQVRDLLELEPLAPDADTRFGDALDSMGFVEFLALVAESCGVPVETIEQATERRYGSVGELAEALSALSFPGSAWERIAGEALPRGLSLAGGEALPRGLSLAGGEALPRGLSLAGGEALPRGLSLAGGEALPRGLSLAGGEALPRGQCVPRQSLGTREAGGEAEPRGQCVPRPSLGTRATDTQPNTWLAATAARLPVHRQPASAINAALQRPPGWLEKHAGIEARCLWADEDPLAAAARAAQDCLEQAGLPAAALGALLVTSEAPPFFPGLAAALHTRLSLASSTVALEIGGACTGFLASLWTACRLLAHADAVLVIAVEAPSRWLSLSPTVTGEAAALFGDAAAACLLTARPTTANALLVRDIQLGSDASTDSLLRVEHELGRGVLLHMEGIPLAHRAVRTMADALRQLCERHNLTKEQLATVVAHGGNGRMPALLARRLGLPSETVWSEAARAGNLGSASVPVAWVSRGQPLTQPAIWVAVGAGLQWGAALFDAPA